MTAPYKMDPAVDGLSIICWYQDFMTKPASRARQIAAGNLFFQAHASATAKLPAQAHASAPTQLPAHDSAHASTSASAEVSPFCGTRLAYNAPPRKQRARPRPGSLKSGSGAPAQTHASAPATDHASATAQLPCPAFICYFAF